jgi:anti-sigma regulatory factor (Ser/Thr protein kinase)
VDGNSGRATSVTGITEAAGKVPFRGRGMAGQWPLQSFLELGALPGAVPCARLHARQMLWEWKLAGLSENVELLVSELLTNAVRSSQSLEPVSPVRLGLLADKVADEAHVLILVWDASPRPPVRIDADEDAESGRGLLLVEAISDQWDWYSPSQETGGKVVWALAATL